jgi:hypothetical protein
VSFPPLWTAAREALPLILGLLTRALIQIKLPIKLAVDAEGGPTVAARSFRSGDGARRRGAKPGTELAA